ncbi:MAG TPA: hypothetical protein VKY66_01215 [Protaetiibacter sp.]|nr:hypothetical protein [Protaetiibacter sp.]
MISQLRVLIPGFWMGLLVALAFIETPLKFLGPGVTVPLALGIGRLVLTAAEIASAVLLLALVVVSFVRPRVGRGVIATLAALAVTLVVQVALVRPALNARTDVVLAGGDPGDSPLHLVYVAIDVVLLALLVVYLVLEYRGRRITSPR